jgi:TolB-like protein
VSGISHAVFLSYASQDAEAAQKICEALRAAGIEVFLDQSELRGGDAWDQKIRREIQDCALFIPVISANTASRHEGYFRLEWDLADQRTHMMARNRAFIVPVCLDATPDAGADVPESFQRVQWTRLPRGDTPPEFVRRIQQLRSGEASSSPTAARGVPAVASRTSSRLKPAWVAVALAAVAAYCIVEKPWVAKSVAFAPPQHSIAVLPFVNMSGDKEQEYFSDGLTEELLNSLAEINELQVAGHTSAFSFKGKDTDIGTIARKLNVGAVLEGSVRRSGNTVRVTTQLINAVTGFHLWSHTYDRDLGDVLKLQTEIATAVAGALKVTLLGDVAAKVELGGTRNPAAFDAYLRGAKAVSSIRDTKDLQPRLRPTRKRFASIRTMRSRSQPDHSSLPASPWRPRPQRRRVRALTRRRRMRARRSRSHRIWPRPTSHWRQLRKMEPSTSRRRVRRTSGRLRSRRAMRRFCD